MRVLFFLFLFLFSLDIDAQGDKNSVYFYTKEGAIKGYDPVAYFISNRPVKGVKTISYLWNNVTWYFESLSNKQLFVNNPEKYAPQYGGYCAYGWAQGYAVKIDPDAWDIVNGKLYLNYSKGVQKDWNKDREAFIKKADLNFRQK